MFLLYLFRWYTSQTLCVCTHCPPVGWSHVDCSVGCGDSTATASYSIVALCVWDGLVSWQRYLEGAQGEWLTSRPPPPVPPPAGAGCDVCDSPKCDAVVRYLGYTLTWLAGCLYVCILNICGNVFENYFVPTVRQVADCRCCLVSGAVHSLIKLYALRVALV